MTISDAKEFVAQHHRHHKPPQKNMTDHESSTQVWRDHGRIMRERMDKNREVMEEYDRTVYRPAMKALRERCERIGHIRGKFHDNGLGWSWFYCNQCGARMEIEGPEPVSKV